MNDEEYNRCCKILEVPPEATMGDIRRSYLHLRELYSVDSLASIALEDEFSASEKKGILEEVEQAYQTLMGLVKKEREPSDSDEGLERDDKAVAEILESIETFDGPALRRIREKMGIALDDIAVTTRIQRPHLMALEEDNFDALPAEVYTRGFVSSYAEFLCLDVRKVAMDYMGRFRKWKSDNHRGSTIGNLFSKFKVKK